MPGNKADGAVMVLQTRRTRHRRQSNDCRAWRGQSECGASIAAKRRPAFSADSKHSIPTQHCTAMSAHRMPLRHSGIPCNTFAAHPAAPLVSKAAKRRPVSFAPYHPPLPSLPQVCGGEKRASPLQACVKCTSAQFRGGLRRPFM